MLTAASSMALRAASLGARLALTLYMSALLPLAEVGTFGLVAAAAGAAPALFGFGLNYRVGREIVGLPVEIAARRVRDRMAITCAFALIAMLAGLGWWGLGMPFPASVPLIGAILLLECLSADIQTALVSLRHPLMAYLHLFLRSAAWVGPAIAVGVMFPQTRSVDALFAFWLCGLGVAYAAVASALPSGVRRRLWSASPDVPWLWQHLRAGWSVHLNDVVLAGLALYDRALIDHFVDRAAVGTYYLAWSLANAVYALASAAVLQPALPRLVDLWRQGDDVAWRRVLAGEFVRAIGIAMLLAVAIGFLARIAGPRLGWTAETIPSWLLSAMLCAAVIRVGADLLNYGLYAQCRDRRLVSINLGVSVAAACLSLWLVPLFGVGAAAHVAIFLSIALFLARLAALRTRPVKQAEPRIAA